MKLANGQKFESKMEIKEKKLTKTQIRQERMSMFTAMAAQLSKEIEQLSEDFNLARNLACSTWSLDFIDRLVPNQMHPERMDLLQKNFEMLRTELSRKRCYLVEMAIAYLGLKEARICLHLESHSDLWLAYKYWHKELM